ncbi:MAG: hypothetical protein J6V72_20715 [Kiritimatiellae bacterium]|nr:hypothetical protein [Kiritimatiellia bacterium]
MKIKLCNVHKLAVANEGEERKPIFIPFGTWPYDDTISQTLDKPHAEGIAADLDKQIAAGEPGIPVYQGHPDVPEYAGKYPDKGAMGWVKKILVNEDGMECHIEWDRDPGKGFGWFSPYWIGDKPVVGPDGKKNVIVDGLTSIGLVNNPNIREFRLANEAQLEERKPMKPYELPQHIIDLANEYDESKHPRAEDGKWTSGGGAGPKNVNVPNANIFKHSLSKIESRSGKADKINSILRNERKNMKEAGTEFKSGSISGREHREQRRDLRAVHVAAIQSGLSYNRSTHQYE